ncbi:MAG: hypothetical protein J6X33_01765 [Clostridiales bacterium]|nr:hypothetical protein [Clostridiales bacterium]
MNDEYEEIFGFVFQEELAKIPAIFKPGRKLIKVMLVILGVLILGILITVTLYYRTADYGPIKNIGGTDIQVVTYDNRVLVVQIILAVLTALISGWLIISKAMEKRAHRKATTFSAMAYQTQRHRQELKWQEWKMNNRDY